MSCNITPNDSGNRITSFSANYTLNGPMSGSYSMVDYSCLDQPDCGMLCKPVTVNLDVTATVSLEDATEQADLETCYQTNPNWLNGLKRQVSISNNISTFTVESFSTYLQTKPISSQLFQGSQLSSVLPLVLQYYAGIPTNLYDISEVTDTFIKGPVQGQNLYQELLELARAAKCNLYTQVGGVLEFGRWKDHTDPVELKIPDTLVISANPANYKYPDTAVIRSKGASISGFDCGEQTITNDSQTGYPGSTKRCTIAGVPTPSASTSFNNLNGNKEDILSGRFFSDNSVAVGEKQEVQEGSFKQEISKIDGEFFTELLYESSFLVAGPISNYKNESIYGYYYNQDGGGGYGANNRGFFDLAAQALQFNFPVPYSIFGFGAFGSNSFARSGQTTQSGQSNQSTLVETEVVASLDLTNRDCGISQETITNKYLYKKEDLFNQAVRRYQEILMAQNAWNVEIKYLPCIKINQVVQFTVPCTEDCPEKTVIGIVSGINISSTLKEGVQSTIMRLSILGTECLGSTEIISNNLIETGCSGSGGALNPWQESALGVEQGAEVSGGSIALFNIGNGQAFAWYTHLCGSTDDYDLSFDYQNLQGTNVFDVAGVNGATFSATLAGDGAFSQVFTPTGSSFEIRFNMFPNIDANYKLISNIQLIKRVFA